MKHIFGNFVEQDDKVFHIEHSTPIYACNA